MKEARYLIRLVNKGHLPKEHGELLAQIRERALALEGKVINLRVSPAALEFDLFCTPDAPVDPFFDRWKTVGDRLTVKRLDISAVPASSEAVVAEARLLFNEHRFWEVHEVLEALWKERSGPEKQLIQGLILAAAALVHFQKDEEPVTRRMLADALKRLEHQPPFYQGWDIQKFRDHFSRALAGKKLEIPTV